MFTTELPLSMIDAVVVRALEEDLGAGDVTTEACVPEEQSAAANGVARKEAVACGLPVAVNPDPRLRRIAMKRGWRVESW